MFNLIMGIIMILGGVVAMAYGAIGTVRAGLIFFASCIILFGVVEIIRSKSIRARKALSKDRELDMFMAISNETGVTINPLTGEVIKKKDNEADAAANTDETGDN